MKLLDTIALLLFALFARFTYAATKEEYSNNALNATDVLNNVWYNSQDGLWQYLWWNSANFITTLANFAALNNSDYLSVALPVFGDTFSAAPASNNVTTGTFLNNFYDDEGWWALAWIRVYDLLGDKMYLNTAQVIFEDMRHGENATCGGHWWNKEKTMNTAIGNELYIAVAAALANRVVAQRVTYGDIATREFDWFMGSGLVNSNNTISDHLNLETCKPEGNVWSYNQGVILGALVELERLTSNATYLDTAGKIAHAAIDHLTDSNGILTDPGEPGPMDDTSAQFKGVFARNLAYLQSVAPDDAYVTFLQRNADAIWSQDRQDDGRIGPDWQGPYFEASASSQGSALDCIVAAASVS